MKGIIDTVAVNIASSQTPIINLFVILTSAELAPLAERLHHTPAASPHRNHLIDQLMVIVIDYNLNCLVQQCLYQQQTVVTPLVPPPLLQRTVGAQRPLGCSYFLHTMVLLWRGGNSSFSFTPTAAKLRVAPGVELVTPG